MKTCIDRRVERVLCCYLKKEVEGAMDESIAIEEKISGEVLVLLIKGRLDAISSVDVERQIFNYISEGHHNLVLNFSQVDYLSSIGMRLLLRTTKKLKMLSGRLVVCEINTNVMDILKMSGFDHVIEFSSNEQDALKKF